MMTDTLCNYPDRDERLVAYLYDDIDSTERTAFGAHLSTCGSCQEDLSALRGVRSALSAWAPPEPAFASRGSRAPRPEPRAPRWWREVPAWAQVAAALFVAGISATIANLDVRYDRSGLSVRTGWSKPQSAPENASPWRPELAALETQLRAKIDAKQASALAVQAAAEQAPRVSEAELRRRVQVLLDEREMRIQNEIALAVASVMKDYQTQRQADLARIDRTIGYVQTNTLSEQLKQREAVNYLLRVSQTR
jgi:Putative zinc-finger